MKADNALESDNPFVKLKGIATFYKIVYDFIINLERHGQSVKSMIFIVSYWKF